jgi:hypothetical protein
VKAILISNFEVQSLVLKEIQNETQFYYKLTDSREFFSLNLNQSNSCSIVELNSITLFQFLINLKTQTFLMCSQHDIVLFDLKYY